MKRVLLDTNIYGEMVIDPDIDVIKENIKHKTVIYGFRLIRKELRAVSKSKYIGNHGLRLSLLALYDAIAKKEYEITDEMKRIAESYYKAYREFGGSKSMDSIINDFIIVACASVHAVDSGYSCLRRREVDADRECYPRVQACQWGNEKENSRVYRLRTIQENVKRLLI